MNQANRILLNTIAQYIKVIVGAIILLYSTRLVFQQLGDIDYGIYSLIAGLLAFFTFLGTALSRSTQRYLSFSMGGHDSLDLKRVFFNSLFLHFIVATISAIVVFLFEPILFDHYLVITEERLLIAKILYRFLAVGLFFTILQCPYNAAFIAHENIVFVSVLYIAMAILRLAFAFIIIFLDSGTKLLVYGVLMSLSHILEYLVLLIVSTRCYAETKCIKEIKLFDKGIIKEMFLYTLWTAYGAFCIMGRSQGYSLVINRYMGLAVNASYGIASQVAGQVNNLVYSVSNAVSPVISRSEGAMERDRMIYFSYESSKLSLISYALIAMPLIVEMRYILTIWLGSIPDYAVEIITIILISSFLDTVASGLRTGIQAIGNIATFSKVVYTIKVFSLPLAFFLCRITTNIYASFLPFLISELIGTISTVYYFSKYTQTTQRNAYSKILIISLPTVLVSVLTCIILHCIISTDSFIKLIIICIISILSSLMIAYFTALDIKEKKYIKKIITKWHHS